MTVEHNPDEVEAEGQKLIGIGESINTDVSAFRDAAGSLGGCFGDGEIGNVMSEQHTALLEAALEVFYEAALGITDTGADLKQFAKNWREADDKAHSDFGRIETGGR